MGFAVDGEGDVHDGDNLILNILSRGIDYGLAEG
jgi:hypothetical protein